MIQSKTDKQNIFFNISSVVTTFPLCHWGCVSLCSSCSISDTCLFFTSSPNGSICLQIVEPAYLSYLYDISLCPQLLDFVSFTLAFIHSHLTIQHLKVSVFESHSNLKVYAHKRVIVKTSYCLADELPRFSFFMLLSFANIK